MKRMSLLSLIFLAASALPHMGCGNAESTVVLSPADGAAGQAVDVAVTAVFSGVPAQEPTASIFKLKKDNTGETLCTMVTYDSGSLTATCAHADLERGASYTASLSGISNFTDAATTFTTVAAVSPTMTLKDGVGTTIDTTGSTGVDPAVFTLTFSEAMDSVTVTTAGNITLACGSLTPSIAVAESSSTEYTVTVTDAYKYQLLDCTLSITTNVLSASGAAIAQGTAYTFTNTCAVSDDFNADSSGCWSVYNTVGLIPGFAGFSSWTDLLNTVSGALTFNASGSSLDYDSSNQSALNVVTVYKDVTVGSSGFEIIVHLSSLSGFSTDSDQLLISVVNNAAPVGVTTGISGRNIRLGIQHLASVVACTVMYDADDGGYPEAAVKADCSSLSEVWLKLGTDGATTTAQYSATGESGDYQNMTGSVGSISTNFSVFDFAGVQHIVVQAADLDANGLDHASIESIDVVRGITGADQY